MTKMQKYSILYYMSETRQKLQKEAEITHDSIEWWKAEMSALIKRTDHWEEKGEGDPRYIREMNKIQEQMNYLLCKGEWENSHLLNLQGKINKYESDKAFSNFELIEKKSVKKKKK